jgi:hypothetical protein
MLTTILVIVGVGAVVYFGYQKFGTKKTTTTTTKKSVTGGGGSRTTTSVGDKPKVARPKK